MFLNDGRYLSSSRAMTLSYLLLMVLIAEVILS